MTAPIEVFRMGTLGTGTVEVGSLIYSLIVTCLLYTSRCV